MVLITPEIIIILGIVVLGVWSLKQLRENFSERLFFLNWNVAFYNTGYEFNVRINYRMEFITGMDNNN